MCTDLILLVIRVNVTEMIEWCDRNQSNSNRFQLVCL